MHRMPPAVWDSRRKIFSHPPTLLLMTHTLEQLEPLLRGEDSYTPSDAAWHLLCVRPPVASLLACEASLRCRSSQEVQHWTMHVESYCFAQRHV